MSEKKGLIMVYTGDGKGKTTASLGLALRAVGHGGKVCMIQFMKGRLYGEIKAANEFLPNLEIILTGRDEFVNKDNPEEIDIKYALEGLEKVKTAIRSNKYDLIIMDEINVAMDYALFSVEEIVKLMKEKPAKLDVVLTGRYAPKEIIDIADMVSEVKDTKHHYYNGVKARIGIEY